MHRSCAALILALSLAAGFAQAKPAPRPHRAGPVVAKPAQGAAAPAEPAGPFDARNPAGLVSLLSTVGAKAEIANRQEDVVALKVTSPGYGFAAQFAGCDAQGRGCKALSFDGVSEQRSLTLAEINRFNQTSINCHAYQDGSGKLHAWYSTLVFASTTREDMVTHLGAWQGCWASFGEFLKNPAAYLASAP